jgi:tryptophanase
MYEPYRIKTVESLPRMSAAARGAALENAGYNTFHLAAGDVEIDLVSDSGTGAMSSAQWSAVVEAREDFSGQSSHREFVARARAILGFEHVQPVHQGRAAENLLFRLLVGQRDIAVSNTFFETTRANIEALGGEARDLPDTRSPWCGNMDLERLGRTLGRNRRVRLIVLTVTSNIAGGQPVSVDNIRRTRELADRSGVLVALDASRFVGNAQLVKELTGSRKSIRSICRELFEPAHLAFLSCKKDGLANVGGVIAFDDSELLEPLAHEMIRQESYPSAGGLAARDLAAMTVGLEEAVDDRVAASHVGKVRLLAEQLESHGVAIGTPVGAHGVVIPSRNDRRHAAHSLAAAIYLEGGVRAAVFGDSVRLALPRRVYTRDHIERVAEVVGRAIRKPPMRLRCVHRPAEFFNFFARFEPMEGDDDAI